MSNMLYQYCPKIAVFDKLNSSVLLCKRKGEMDYDGVFSFIGGKMEHGDTSIVDALSREKNEEVGKSFSIRLLTVFSIDVLFKKKDGSHMILPHFYAEHMSGEPVLSDEYSEHVWVPIGGLKDWQPKIDNIGWITPALQRAASAAKADEFVEI